MPDADRRAATMRTSTLNATCLLLTTSITFALSPSPPEVMDLQAQHRTQSPPSVLESIAESCRVLDVEKADVYGDYSSDAQSSYLRQFEAEIALAFGKEDAVFMPSGVMAQGIALLVHAGSRRSREEGGRYSEDAVVPRFACHHTSHLLLHEENAYRELLGMEAVVISTKEKGEDGINIPPMQYDDVLKVFEREKTALPETRSLLGEDGLAALIMELPHREIGGKLPPWDCVVRIGDLCKREGVRYHCDGARIFEASAGYGRSLSELASVFDTVYISFYKGLGAASGAMLLGEQDFCTEARVWLRRFGGNLYTLFPYAVSGWAGFRKHFVGEGGHMTFAEKKKKLVRLVKDISRIHSIDKIVRFDPEIPETNMVHGFFMHHSKEECEEALLKVEQDIGIRVLSRIREIEATESSSVYKCKFEWTIGEANGSIKDDAFLLGWRSLASKLSEESKS